MLWAYGLKSAITDHLRTALLHHGPVLKEMNLLSLQAPDGKQGHGFVNFKDQDTAKAAVEAMNGKVIDGAAIFAAPAQKKVVREKILRER